MTDDMNRRVAELLGWVRNSSGNWEGTNGSQVFRSQLSFDTDANQADAAVRERCGDDPDRIYRFCSALYRVTGEVWTEHITDLYVIATATPEQKITALLAAAEMLAKDGGA